MTCEECGANGMQLTVESVGPKREATRWRYVTEYHAKPSVVSDNSGDAHRAPRIYAHLGGTVSFKDGFVAPRPTSIWPPDGAQMTS